MNENHESTNTNITSDSQKNRYLTFKLNDDFYGLNIKFVTEIVGIQDFVRIPETPDYIIGIINLRGRIIPLIDAKLKFKKDFVDYNERTCIIIINLSDIAIGLAVDRVLEVLIIAAEQSFAIQQ